LKGTGTFTSVFRDKNNRNQGFFLLFCLLMEGSGSRRSKNILILILSQSLTAVFCLDLCQIVSYLHYKIQHSSVYRNLKFYIPVPICYMIYECCTVKLFYTNINSLFLCFSSISSLTSGVTDQLSASYNQYLSKVRLCNRNDHKLALQPLSKEDSLTDQQSVKQSV
jgi:hypothetical protein